MSTYRVMKKWSVYVFATLTLLLGCEPAHAQFGPQQNISQPCTACSPQSVHAADLDGDGDADILSASLYDDKIAWYENTGGDSFSGQKVITDKAVAVQSVYTADLDGDGDRDILSASAADDKVAWYENTGGGTFTDQKVITTSAGRAESVHASDLDGDGDQDVLSASAADDKVAWYENTGEGTFTGQKVITTDADAAQSVYTADLDGDSAVDVLSASAADDKVAWYENTGGGTFTGQKVITTDADAAQSVYAADLDGDGDRDILSASAADDKVAWYKNQLSQNDEFVTQGAVNILPNVNDAFSVYASDLDRDGDPDILSASDGDNKIAWFENLGAGSFSGQKVITTSADGAQSVFAQDLDGDSDMDVLSASSGDDKIAWYENLNDGGFSSQNTITTSANGENSVYASDLDGDSDVDVLSASEGDSKIAWYENLDDGEFSSQQVITTGADGASSVFAQDLDGDGDPDVLSASRRDSKIAWYENLDGGGFSSQQVITTSANLAESVYAADLDGDGDPDVLSASVLDDKIAWYENLDGGGFSSQQVITTSANSAESVYAADLDADGDPDVLSASRFDDKVAWYENLGGGAFSGQKVITTSADGAESVYASDLDGDGDPDVLSASQGDDKIAWYRNETAPLSLPFTDNFNDNSIDQNKWETTGRGGPEGDRVAEENGVMKVEVRETDNGGILKSKWIRVGTDTPIRLSQQNKVHYANDKFSGDLRVHIEGKPDKTFGVSYANYDYDGGNAEPLFGIHLFRNAANPNNDCCQDDVSEGIDGIWDQWFSEDLIYDPQTGELQYLIADTTALTYNVGAVSDQDSMNIRLEYQSYGWFTGHYIHLDDFELTQESQATAPSGLVARAEEGEINLQWEGNGASGYNVYRSESSFSNLDNATKLNDTPVPAASYDDDAVEMANAYYYRVTALNGEGNESDLSAEVRVTAGSGARFVWPVDAPRVSQDYATRDFGVAGAYHLGIDLVSSWEALADIYAAADGEVVLMSRNDTDVYGKYLVIDHGDNLYALYAHLSSIKDTLNEGDSVGQGEPVGIMGESGDADGIHLHFDVVARSSDPDSVVNAFDNAYHDQHPSDINHPDPKIFLSQRVVKVTGGDTPVHVRPCEACTNVTTIGQGQEFVTVGPPVDGWHLVYLPYEFVPSSDGSYPGDYDRYGWVNGQALTVVEPGPRQIRIDGQKLASEGGEYLRVRGGPDTSEVILNKVWDGQRFVTDGSPQEGPGSTQPWYKIHLSENAGASEGWVAGDFVSVVPPQASGILAAATRLVNTDGDVKFGGSGAHFQFNGVSGSGKVTLKKYGTEPSGTGGISETNVSDYRFVIESGGDLSFDSSSELRLAVTTLRGIDNPGNVTIYQRDNVGAGTFSFLETTVDDNGTPDISDDTLSATTGSFSEFVLASNTEPLPVELTRFDASVKSKEVLLKWRTAGETSNSGFVVQRRGSDTAPWTRVTFVDGAGTTSSPQTYRYRDAELPYAADSLIYRLKQVDADGSTSVSDPITVRRGAPETVQLLGTYPNPARTRATVRYALPQRQRVTVRLFDALGRRVATIMRGRKDEGRHQRQIDTSRLPSGVYFLRLTTESTTKTQRLTVVR